MLQQRIKLLISLSYYAPHISGLTISLQHLAELFATNGYKVTVLATQHEKRLPLKEKIHNVSIIRVPYLFRLSKGFVMPGFSQTAFRLLKENDVVLITLPQAQSLAVAILAKLLGKKVICLYICEVTLPEGHIASIVKYLLQIVNRLTLLFADKIVTLTDDFAKHNNILQATGKKIFAIYPVVIPPCINKVEQEALRNKFPQKKYYIGFLGRIASEKGIEYLLKTIPLLQKELGDEFVIVLAGPKKTVGEDAYKKKIEVLLHYYSSYVMQVGELAEEQLGAFYALLDVFVLPSINNTEAFGMVQVESMYCGTPVIATDLPGVRVPIQETGMGVIVTPLNVSLLAQAIVKVLKNKKRYVKDISVIRGVFSEEEILKSYQNIFGR